MTKKRATRREHTRFLGTYELPGAQHVVGELALKGSNTSLILHSDECLQHVEANSCIKGTAYTGENLTLIDCRSPGTGQTTSSGAPTRYHARVFPHFVVIGKHHVESLESCISAIHFSTTDLSTLFYDFDAFGLVANARPIIDTVLQERRLLRPVEAGEDPLVFYFTGKTCITEVQTALGKVSVHHRPSHTLGGPEGVYVKNRIVVSIEPENPVKFDDALSGMYDMATFLSMAAGRAQGIEHIHITVGHAGDGAPQMLAVHPSFRWKANGKSDQHKPHPADVPLDPVRERTEFDAVLANWLSRHTEWRISRSRYLACLRKANRYGPDRLVAAANMFDILPASALPAGSPLQADLAATRDACAELFKKHPPGSERDRALSDLGRLGRLSLPKKVAHRVSIVEVMFGTRLPDLQLVSSVAIRCRNFFVHGSSGDFDFNALEPFVPFLTDALEFIYSASDFIDAGWDAKRWNSEAHSWGHNFARFRWGYGSTLSELRRALER